MRVLLGGGFVVFGLNGFLYFMKMEAPPAAGAAFFGALFQTKYMIPLIFGTELLGGLMVLTGLFLPLGLTLLAPILLNVILFHLFLAPGGMLIGILFTALELYLVIVYRKYFAAVLTSVARLP